MIKKIKNQNQSHYPHIPWMKKTTHTKIMWNGGVKQNCNKRGKKKKKKRKKKKKGEKRKTAEKFCVSCARRDPTSRGPWPISMGGCVWRAYPWRGELRGSCHCAWPGQCQWRTGDKDRRPCWWETGWEGCRRLFTRRGLHCLTCCLSPPRSLTSPPLPPTTPPPHHPVPESPTLGYYGQQKLRTSHTIAKRHNFSKVILNWIELNEAVESV